LGDCLFMLPGGDFAQYACLLGSGSLKQGEMALFGLILPPGFEAVGDGGPCSLGEGCTG
jgi:hypothetical protein